MTSILYSIDPITRLARQANLSNWEDLLTYVQHLPYGRTSNPTDLSLVITEQKGTCSSKHALLKKLADENKIKGVELILGMYLMNEANTPGIYPVLTNSGLSAIPEAHCYLQINGLRMDLTNPQSNIDKLRGDILEEISIQPEQVGAFKRSYHKNYLRKYKKEKQLTQSFEQLWQIRENCIKALSTNRLTD
ncbi:MAG: hypothetical protein AAFP08_05230 [Bacteroidota bacterium]